MTRPPRRIIPTFKLTADNAGELELASHRRVVAVASASASAALTAPEPISSPLPGSSPYPQTDTEDASSPAADTSQARSSSKRPYRTAQGSLSLDSVIVLSPTSSDVPDGAPKTKKPKASLASGDQDTSQISIIDIDDTEDPQDERLNKSDPTADIKYFFTAVPRVPGQAKRRMRCILCT